jgi:serine/threonine-protein kinase ULK/ATG1
MFAANPSFCTSDVTYGCFAGIKRTKLRLVRCRDRMAMNDRDRLKDARADQNLVDVARYPAPWELRPLEQPQSSPTSTS